ncbi:hypothetical protein [Rufibacter sp. LB8]|uniref:hypothetical protein n=1 Tax=Rufibacter sp. LB8 TaxID=2777781 RepID=UPI00178C1BD0|nr:hypothetical protein [Rufibacter sp. LB8]
MKSYLLLGISVLLLLFTLPQPHQAVNRWVSPDTSVLKKVCDTQKHTAKRTCKKKCLRHQTHTSQENNTGTVSDCPSPIYAMMGNTLATPVFYFFPRVKVKGNLLAVSYLPPPLERELNPPRVS